MKRELANLIWEGVDHLFSPASIKSTKELIAQTAANMFTAGPNYFYVIDFARPMEFEFLSPQTGNFLGVNQEQYNVEAMFGRIHPEDVDHIKVCEQRVFDFIENEIDKTAILNYKFSYQFRLKVKDTYRMMLHQAVTLSTDGFGRISKVLSIDTVIDHITQVNNKHLSIIGLNGVPSYLAIDVWKERDFYEPHPENIFTQRELQIIRCFADGQTAKSIAVLLQIAEETVRTHRKNILKKSDCPNMTALVADCIRKGLI